MKYIIILVSLVLFSPAWADGSRYAGQSVLSEGKWVRIEVGETGIYKLSYKDIEGMGFPDPGRVSIHGYGGWLLSENLLEGYTDDLPAVAVWRGPDYLLFYAKGTVKWEYDTATNTFRHTNNPYATSGYYFLTDAAVPREMEEVSFPDAGASLQITGYDDYMLHEKELVSVNDSGRELFGDYFEGNTSVTIPFSVPGILEEDGKLTLSFISKPAGGYGTVSLSAGQEKLTEATISPVDGSDAYVKARMVQRTVDWKGAKTEEVNVKVSYAAAVSHTNTRLDYIRLQAKRALRPYGAFTFFRSVASVNNTSRFVIREATAHTLVFDVTDGINPKRMAATLNGSELSFTIPAGALREFVIVQTDKTFPAPVKAADVANQNLHGLEQTAMVIIALPMYREQAGRLAAAHRERDGLTVEVVEPQLIYNEFSSGTPDATAYRRFMKMFYDRGTSEEDRPKYLLLFGDGVFDNRALTADFARSYSGGLIYQRMLLTYQSVNSVDAGSYVTDDYFGFLSDANHTSPAKPIYQWKLDIGVGRLPVRTLDEAAGIVDKLIGYMDNRQQGVWKNNVCFVADDGNTGDSYTTIHAWQADSLTRYLETSHPEFLVNKVFFDAYRKDFSGASNPYPDVRNRIQKLLKSGLLFINYTGHGNTKAWADEQVLTDADITGFNYPVLPLWITASCDFSRFDAPATSAGEKVILNRSSGGIALYTTTRVVFREPNFRINNQLIRHLFEKKENGRRLTLGEVMKETKNSSELASDDNKLNFILLGDPAMKLAYPEYRIRLTAVNGEPVQEASPALKALDKVTVEGEIQDPEGRRATDFNGSLKPTVLDSKVTVKTLNNNGGEATFTYTDYPNVLFAGNDVVAGGMFRFTFTVPKDISYSNDFGKMNLYAWDEQSGTEAQGAYLGFRVGGTSAQAEEDTEGPEIRALFLNDTTFTGGGRVNTTPLFVASLWDKSGVNISGSSIGHDMMLVIDGNPALSYTLNDYYETIPGSEGEGIVSFSIPALKAGAHQAEFMVWDIYNNSSHAAFAFEVVEGLKPVLSELKATPNPAREQVDFYLSHNRPESAMTVRVMVYDMGGRLLWQQEEKGSSDLFKSYVITWNLTDNEGVRLRPGLYFYRAAVTTDHSKEATRANKLIILAQ
jgi:hypothetical protein